MAHYQCNCTFVPPQVLENLARAGVDNARLSIQQSKISRRKRADKRIDMEAFMGAKTRAKPKRKVYDCQNKWEQRVKLVRGEGKPASGDKDVDRVYTFAGKVRGYFSKVLQRNSIDNKGMDLILNVHFGQDYMNAFWDGDEMTFGDGDGEIFISFTRSLEVVAHELAHGVTQYTADLEYFSQSGALNEHFSDVFGTAITQHALKQDAGQADWLVGDEIMGPDLYGESLRSMQAPGTAYDNRLLGKDPQPAHMNDYYTGNDDNQGVHINSGIPNRAFYLVATEIGTDKATLIWYHALQKLWPTATFNDAVDVIVDSARQLTRQKQVPVGSTQQVRAAFREVGLPHLT
ncbi:MAG: M4 family metallopeptidase [Desulfobacterales bacterium]|nr:M4 family metallopeptidase [Desulfobacterales bacterium]